MSTVEAAVASLSQEINMIKGLLTQLVKRPTIKDFYSTDEFATASGLKAKTVRDYLNEGRLKGVKQRSGHGRAKKLVIPHEKLLRNSGKAFYSHKGGGNGGQEALGGELSR
jgi:hypothetical protein